MKAIAVVLLCAFAAVEPRYTGVSLNTRTPAALSENPWFVHLRLATSVTGGLLRTCAGSLISGNRILTTASCLTQATFIWNRYGVVNVANPSLVTESTSTLIHPNYNAQTGENDIAIVNINRNVESTENIAPVTLAAAGSELPSSGKFCAFGASEDGTPGDNLTCNDFESLDDISATEFDNGAPLVVDGVLYGVVVSTQGTTKIVNVGDYASWIQGTSFVGQAQEGVKVLSINH